MPTLRAHLQAAEHQLQSSPHPEKARKDAESLTLFLLQKNRAWLLANLDLPTPPTLPEPLANLLTRRQAGEPIQYITGQTEFFGLQFQVTPDVLIPRPETEHLVEEVVRLAARFKTPRIADIGTGSGAIAIALAHSLPNSSITATDISPAALKIARKNKELNQVQIEFLEGDLLAPLAGQTFDILASNPPYIPTSDQLSLSVEVRHHEPHLALFAEADGLAIYRKLIPQARHHLNPGGSLVLEIGHGQQTSIQHLLAASGYRNIRFINDYQAIPRVASAQLVRQVARAI